MSRSTRLMAAMMICLCATVGITWFPVSAQDSASEPEPLFKVEPVVAGNMITSIVWASDGRMFWTEKDGIVRVLSPEKVLQEEPVVAVTVQNTNEQGLQSIVLGPRFEEDHFFYIFYTRPPRDIGLPAQDVIVRYREKDGKGVDPVEMLSVDIPNNDLFRHNGGRMQFGPKDGFLYVSIGDMGYAKTSQTTGTLLGRIHRFLVVGIQLIPAPGNPFPGDSTWAFGLRNNFAIAFDSVTGNLFVTENGPSCDDEINLIIPAMNYGWGEDVSCDDPLEVRQVGGRLPLISWTPTIAPTGIIVYDGDRFPEWKGQLMYCAFKLGAMFRVKLDEKRTKFDGDPVEVKVADKASSCFIELAQGPDGYIYYSSLTGIFRLVPG